MHNGVSGSGGNPLLGFSGGEGAAHLHGIYFTWSGYYLGDLLSWQKKTWTFGNILGRSVKMLGFSERNDWNFEKITWIFERNA